MSGERLAWLRVASHLRCTVQELKRKITFTEFLEWLQFLAQEEERQEKIEFYLAQIAAEVRRGQVKHPKQVKLQDFMIEFRKPTTEQQEKVNKSKKAWASFLGLKIEN